MSHPTDFETEAEREGYFAAERITEQARERAGNREAVVRQIMSGMGYGRAKAERLAAKMLGERPRDPLAGRML